MFCSKCGKEMNSESVFCPECGARIQGTVLSSALAVSASKHNLLALIGGTLLVVSFFMPWVDLGFTSLSGYNLIRAASGAQKFIALLAWLIPIEGGITAYLSYTKNGNTIRASLITGIITSIIWGLLFFSLGSEIKGMTGNFSDVFKAMAIGMYLLLGGIVCLALTVKDAYAPASLNQLPSIPKTETFQTRKPLSPEPVVAEIVPNAVTKLTRECPKCRNNYDENTKECPECCIELS